MKVLGVMPSLGPYWHNPAAAFIEDGEVRFAIEEERCIRLKKAPRLFPHNALDTGLEFLGWELEDVDRLAIAYNLPVVTGEDDVALDALPGYLRSVFDLSTVHFVDHHRAHIQAARRVSEGSPSTGVVADAKGEFASASVYAIDDRGVRRIGQIPFEHSLGLYYEAAAGYCRLGPFGAGKLMGLSAYSDCSEPAVEAPSQVLRSSSAIRNEAISVEEASTQFRNWLERFERATPQGRRSPGNNVLEYSDFASGVQKSFERSVLELVKKARAATGVNGDVFAAGGVFLNCVANARVARLLDPARLVVCPAAHDAGTAIGAALDVCDHNDCLTARSRNSPGAVDLGLKYSVDYERHVLNLYDIEATRLPTAELVSQVTDDLKTGKWVLWFQGRDEFGPRALGYRSLLSRAYPEAKREDLNHALGREEWRPLAPVVRTERYSEVFEGPPRLPMMRYMLCTAPVRENAKQIIPAAVHVDGTARPQVVGDSNPLGPLLRHCEETLGEPCLLNTSLNWSGDPIISDPKDAVDMYFQLNDPVSLILDSFYASK